MGVYNRMPTPSEQLDALLATLSPYQGARLTFYDQCAAFYLLKRGFPQALVAKTFDITQSAMSTLARCETNPRRYKQVGDEFRRLGLEAFGEKYTNQDILDRLARFRAEMPLTGDHRKGLRKGRAPNPDSNAYAGYYRDPNDPRLILKITFVNEGSHGHPPGWYLWVKQNRRLIGRGETKDGELLPYLNSKQVYESLCHPDWPDPLPIEDNENKKDKPLDNQIKKD